MTEPVERRFIALFVNFEVDDQFVDLHLRAAQSQLGRASRLLLSHTDGQRKAMSIRLVTRDKPGLAWKATLTQFNSKGRTIRVVLRMRRGLDLSVLEGMAGLQVLVEYRIIEGRDD